MHYVHMDKITATVMLIMFAKENFLNSEITFNTKKLFYVNISDNFLV
jgi:hypothetical protein